MFQLGKQSFNHIRPSSLLCSVLIPLSARSHTVTQVETLYKILGAGSEEEGGTWHREFSGAPFPLSIITSGTHSEGQCFSHQKRDSEKEAGEPDLNSAQVPGSGLEGTRVPQMRSWQKCLQHPRPRVEAVKMQSSAGAPAPPQALQRICLNTAPSPLDCREMKWADMQDHNHHSEEKGSEYGLGLFTLY